MADIGDADQARATLRIGDVSERTGLSQKTIRDYDELGVLHPSARTEGNFRLYSTADVDRLLLIRRLKPLNFSLGETAILLDILHALDERDPDRDLSAVRDRLGLFIQDAEKRRDILHDQITMVDELLSQLHIVHAAS